MLVFFVKKLFLCGATELACFAAVRKDYEKRTPHTLRVRGCSAGVGGYETEIAHF